MTPRVSVLMSVYNGERYLCQAVDSILAQTYADFEFVIVDDGSTDRTWAILEGYDDPRIRLMRNQGNVGLTRSLNRGLALVRGAYIARMDGDDVALPRRLELEARFLDQHPEVVLVSCAFEVIDERGRTVGRYQEMGDPLLTAWHLLFCNQIGGHGRAMFRREPVLEIGGYDERWHYSQDYDLWQRLIERGEVVILPDVLLQRRRHQDSISSRAVREQEAHSLMIARENIAALIGEALPLEHVAQLRRFWAPPFPERHSLAAIHASLSRICPAYLRKRRHPDLPRGTFSRRVRAAIGGQFLRWAYALRAEGAALAELQVSLYAYAWHPPAAIRYSLAYLWSLPTRATRVTMRGLRALVRNLLAHMPGKGQAPPR